MLMILVNDESSNNLGSDAAVARCARLICCAFGLVMCFALALIGVYGCSGGCSYEAWSIEPADTIELPSLVGCDFTCTGLTYDTRDEAFWLGNYGATEPGALPQVPSIVKLSPAMEVLQVVDLRSMGIVSDEHGVQGVAYDCSDDAVWFCAASAVWQMDKDSLSVIGKIEMPEGLDPNGVAYDVKTDSLWVLCYSEFLINISKSGQIIGIYPCDIRDQDHVAFDADGKLYFTAGADYHGDYNWLYAFDAATASIRPVCKLYESYSMEGICFIDNSLYVANDGVYHEAEDRRNIVNVYDLGGVRL